MPRDEITEYQQDNLGNERKRIDELRAREGGVGGGDNEGITEVVAADVGTNVLLYEKPRHASEVIVLQIEAFSAGAAAGDTFTIYEAETDDAGAITNTTRRTVPINLPAGETITHEYVGSSFADHIAVNSDAAGFFSVGVISDHHEEDEPSIEVTEAP